MRRFLALVWRAIDSLSVAAWLLSLGIGGLVITGVSQVVTIESPWNVVFFISLFLVAASLTAPLSRAAVSGLTEWTRQVAGREPAAPTTTDPTPADASPEATREAQLRAIRTIRSEIEIGRNKVERAIGVVQVHESASDMHWVAHRNSLVAIPEAGHAYALAVVAWEEGLYAYNRAVSGRTRITDDELREISGLAARAIAALGVAASKLES